MTCASCAAEIGPSLLSCPRCHAFVHAERLKALASEASAARVRQNLSAEVAAWRAALNLLPPESTQHAQIRSRVEQLGATLIEGGSAVHASGGPGLAGQDAGQAPGRKKWAAGGLSGLGVLILTKGKLLLLGLTKSSTLLSMIPALGVYWAVFGWGLAAGLIASIYVHEMGHVVALGRFGIQASAPMFLPGLGAVIRSRLQFTQPREEARVGIAGPIWGLGAAVAAFAIYALTGAPIWAAIGRLGAWINLFNLVPVWQLDGARAFKAMNRQERWLMVAVIAAMFFVTHEGLLVLLGIMASVQAFRAEDWPAGDRPIAAQYAALVLILSALSTVSQT